MKTILNIILTPFKMIWSIFDNDAHRIVSKKGLNLIEMEDKLDKQLAKETVKSLSDFIKSKRDEDIESWAETARTKINQMVYCCNGENEEHIFDIGFIEGYKKARVNCDVESAARELHIYNLGLNDGYNKAGYKKSEETDETELADIRNKLGALKNLIQLIERGYIVPDDKLKEIVEQSIPICKESIEYLANGNFKQNKKPNE
jgi:glutathionyl-hydroquinone reductase